MKSRIIIKNRKFVPQVKKHWWNSWAGLCRGNVRSYLGMYKDFDSLEDAIKEIKAYREQKIDDDKIVWNDGTD